MNNQFLIICGALICVIATAFGAYQIGYSNGADGNYRLMMQEWAKLKLDREKLQEEKSRMTNTQSYK